MLLIWCSAQSFYWFLIKTVLGDCACSLLGLHFLEGYYLITLILLAHQHTLVIHFVYLSWGYNHLIRVIALFLCYMSLGCMKIWILSTFIFGKGTSFFNHAWISLLPIAPNELKHLGLCYCPLLCGVQNWV